MMLKREVVTELPELAQVDPYIESMKAEIIVDGSTQIQIQRRVVVILLVVKVLFNFSILPLLNT